MATLLLSSNMKNIVYDLIYSTMVSTTVNNNETVDKKPTGLPEGKYRLVGWDIDTTGRRLIDEICQIAAYTTNAQFAQYVMPYASLNPFAQRRHNIRVVTVSRYRMLKDLKTNKFLKTKSEISALTDFISWLEQNRGDGTDGVILVFHEVRKLAPAMMLEALRRYNLLERFSAVVKGFTNSYQLAESKCANTMKSFSMKVLSRVLLDKDEDLNNAADRARLCYLIVQHLGQGERQDLDSEGSGDTGSMERHATALVQQFAQTITTEEVELAELKALLERQNTFRPVFKDMMSNSSVTRQHASWLRHILVQNNFDYNQLKNAWESGGKAALEEQLKMISNANEKEYPELLEILDCHFDPDKKPTSPTKSDSSPEKSASVISDPSSPQSNDTTTPRSSDNTQMPVAN
ncbi:exuperantia [Carabus blaptoides fortunei]